MSELVPKSDFGDYVGFGKCGACASFLREMFHNHDGGLICACRLPSVNKLQSNLNIWSIITLTGGVRLHCRDFKQRVQKQVPSVVVTKIKVLLQKKICANN